MASIDDMHGLVGQGQGTKHPQSQAGSELWVLPPTMRNGTGFTVYLDVGGNYWSLTDGVSYVVERGLGSVSLADAMRRKGIIL